MMKLKELKKESDEIEAQRQKSEDIKQFAKTMAKRKVANGK